MNAMPTTAKQAPSASGNTTSNAPLTKALQSASTNAAQQTQQAPASQSTQSATPTAQTQQQAAPQAQQQPQQQGVTPSGTYQPGDTWDQSLGPGQGGWVSPGQQTSVEMQQQTAFNADPNNAKNYSFDGSEVSKNYLENLVNGYNPNIPNAMQPGEQKQSQAALQALQTGSGSFDPSNFSGRQNNMTTPSAESLASGYQAAQQAGTATDPNAWLAQNDPSMVSQQGLNGATYNPQTKSWANNGPSFNPTAARTSAAPSSAQNSQNISTLNSSNETALQAQAAQAGYTSVAAYQAANPAAGQSSSPGATTQSPSLSTALQQQASAAASQQAVGTGNAGAATAGNPAFSTPFGYNVAGSPNTFTPLPTQYAGTNPVNPAAQALGLSPTQTTANAANMLANPSGSALSNAQSYNPTTQAYINQFMAEQAPMEQGLLANDAAQHGVLSGSGSVFGDVAIPLEQQAIAYANANTQTAMQSNNNFAQALAQQITAASMRPNQYASPQSPAAAANSGGAPTVPAPVTPGTFPTLPSTSTTGTTDNSAQNAFNAANPLPNQTQPNQTPVNQTTTVNPGGGNVVGASPGNVGATSATNTGVGAVDSTGQPQYIVVNGVLQNNPNYNTSGSGSFFNPDGSGSGQGVTDGSTGNVYTTQPVTPAGGLPGLPSDFFSTTTPQDGSSTGSSAGSDLGSSFGSLF